MNSVKPISIFKRQISCQETPQPVQQHILVGSHSEFAGRQAVFEISAAAALSLPLKSVWQNVVAD